MSKFKVGDKVRVLINETNALKDDGNLFRNGDIGIITESDCESAVRISDNLSSLVDVESLELIDNNMVVDQEHYTNNDIQPIEIMKANFTKEEYRGFLLGNIVKYPLRYKDKNGLRDLKTTYTYLTWLIQDIEERGL